MNKHPTHSRKVSLLLLALSLLSFIALLTSPLQGIFPARAGIFYGENICSDNNDIFLVEETTSEYIVIPIVDDTTECRMDSRSALNRDNLFIYNRLTKSWDRVAAATHDAQSLYASLNASWLDGTPFVADAVDPDVFLPVMVR